jgi:hypothetical protein
MVRQLEVVIRKSLGFALVLTAMGSVAFAAPAVPEIDAGSAASAVTLLCAGALMLKNKFRAK